MNTSCQVGNTAAVVNFKTGFERYGRLLARRPWTAISLSLAICSISAVGFVRFKKETNWVDVWVAPTSVSFSRTQNDQHLVFMFRTQKCRAIG